MKRFELPGPISPCLRTFFESLLEGELSAYDMLPSMLPAAAVGGEPDFVTITSSELSA